MSKEDGGPAFPANDAFSSGGDSHVNEREYKGMSLRDYFAGQALAGMINLPGRFGKALPGMSAEECHKSNLDGMALTCYEFSDAMLEARKK